MTKTYIREMSKLRPGWIIVFAIILSVIFYVIGFRTAKSGPVRATSDQHFPTSVSSFIEVSERIWARSVQRRHAIVGATSLEKINAWDYGNHVILWDYFYPTFSCPRHMERLGKVGDGGKWVCGFSLFESLTDDDDPPCVVYSFGVSSETSFEEEIVNRSRCQIWAYDYSVDNVPKSLQNESRVHFKKMMIGGVTSQNSITLGDTMKQNGHNWIDILKVDIEGSEFELFNQTMDQFEILPFGQLQVEFHTTQKTFKDFYIWFERLEGKGLRAIFMEPNHYANRGTNPWFMEYVFLNVRVPHKVIQ